VKRREALLRTCRGQLWWQHLTMLPASPSRPTAALDRGSERNTACSRGSTARETSGSVCCFRPATERDVADRRTRSDDAAATASTAAPRSYASTTPTNARDSELARSLKKFARLERLLPGVLERASPSAIVGHRIAGQDIRADVTAG